MTAVRLMAPPAPEPVVSRAARGPHSLQRAAALDVRQAPRSPRGFAPDLAAPAARGHTKRPRRCTHPGPRRRPQAPARFPEAPLQPAESRAPISEAGSQASSSRHSPGLKKPAALLAGFGSRGRGPQGAGPRSGQRAGRRGKIQLAASTKPAAGSGERRPRL